MSPTTRKRLHIAAAALFAVQVPIALLTDIKESVPYLVFLSIYANIVGHLSGASAELPSEGA